MKTETQPITNPTPCKLNIPRRGHLHSFKLRSLGTWTLLLSIFLSLVPGLQAALRTWNGGTDIFWGNALNWTGGAVANGDDLVFDGATRTGNSNSIVTLRINSLAYNTSGFTNIGQALMITNGIVDIAGGNTNNIALTLGGSQSISNQSALTLVLGGTIAMSNYNLTVSSSGGGNVFLNGVISGNGLVGVNSLNIYDGITRLAGANTFNGGININSGTLMLANGAAIPSGGNRGNVNIASGAILNLNGNSQTVNGLAGAGTVDNLAGTATYTLTVGAGNSNEVFSGVIQNTSGTVALAKTGNGTETLAGANTYIGSTTIGQGILILGAGGSIASTNIVISSGAMFDVSAVGGFTLNGNLLGGRTSGFTNDITGAITMNSGNLTPVPGLAGTLTINGNLTLNGGTVNYDLSSVTTVGAGVNDLISLTNGGNLNISGGTTTIKIKPLVGSLASGTYTLIRGSAANIVGSPANLVLAAPRGISATFDTTTEPTNLLVVASGASTPASIVWAGNGAGGPWDVVASLNWLNNGVPDVFYDLDSAIFNESSGAANSIVSFPGGVIPSSTTVSNSTFNYTFGVGNVDPGLIGGTGGLTKNGSGVLVLNTPNTFTGPTTINGGSIVLGNFTTGNLGVNQIVLYNGVTPGTVVFGNGGIFMSGAANTQEIVEFGVTISPGGSSLAARGRQANATPFWTIDNISRNVGGTWDLNGLNQRTGSHCGIYFTNPVPITVNGILGGWATWNLNDWIVPLNTLVGALPYAGYQVNLNSSLWGSLSNINVTATPSAIAASTNINSLKMTAAATVTIGAGQSLTLSSGGLLVPNNATGAGVVTGGTLLGATNADLIVLHNNSANALTIGSVIADNTNNAATSGSVLTKAGQGTLILTGNNTYSGVTYINGATLSGNGNGNNLPTSIAAGTLQIGSGGTSGGISNSPSVANLGTLAFSRSDTVGYAGPISGTGGVKQQGTGASVLTADNTYSGVTTITAGTMQIGNGGASGSFSNSVSVLNAAALVINRTGTLGYSGPISGIGSLTVQGGGSVVLNNTNIYTGGTTISAGKLFLGATGSISNSSLITVASGAVLDATAPGGLTLGTAQVVAGSGGVNGNVTSGSTTRLSPAGDGVIGTLTLSNALALIGGTVTIDMNAGGSRDLLDVKGNLDLTSGTIALNNLGGSIPNGTYKLIGYAGTLSGSAVNLSVSGFSQIGQLASLSSATAGEIDLVVVTGFGADLTWLGDGSGNLWNLIGALNFTNSAGVVTNFHNNDNVKFDDAGVVNSPVNVSGSLSPALVQVNSASDYTWQGSGKIAGGSSLIKSGAANLIVLTTNNFTGPTTISSGTLTLGDAVANDGTLGSGNITNNAALVINEFGDETLSGAISGTGSITIGGAGKVTLTGNNSGFSGLTTINAGIVQVGSGGAAGTLGTGGVVNNTALVINRSGTLAVGSSISGTGSLTNNGVGAVTLNGTDTYAGATVIANGTVKAGSSAALPYGAGVANVIMDGGATAAGILDLNGFDLYLNGLDGASGTVLAQVVNNSGSATKNLSVGNGDAAGTFSGMIRDNSGSGGKIALVKTGTGNQTLNIVQALGNLYTGGTVISNGTLTIATPGGASPLIIGANAVSVGSGPVTFYGGSLAVAGSIPQNNGPTWGAFNNTLIVPAGQTGTVHPTQRGAFNSALQGAGTFNYVAAYVRGSMGGDWSAFTGQIILSGDSNGNFMGLDSALGMPNARVYFTNNLNYGLNLFGRLAGTPTIPIGELAGGDDGTALVSTSPGGAGGLAANFAIGGLNTSTNFNGRIGDNVGIIKVGTGTLTLTNVNMTYTGITTVSNGALVFIGATPPSSTFTLASPGILDVSALGTLTVGNTAQTIRGNGTLAGSLALTGSGTAVVGFTNKIGTLTVTNDVNLGGTVYMELNRTNAVGGTNDQIAAATITLGGSLTVTNIGPALQVGNTFKLFKASGALSGAISATLPATDANNMGYTWTDNTAVDGTITVLTAVTLVNQTPANIDATVSGNQLTLTWPADHIGWRLQVQTNAITTGLASNWFDVAGSTTTNTLTFTLDPANGSVFYRMVYP